MSSDLAATGVTPAGPRQRGYQEASVEKRRPEGNHGRAFPDGGLLLPNARACRHSASPPQRSAMFLDGFAAQLQLERALAKPPTAVHRDVTQQATHWKPLRRATLPPHVSNKTLRKADVVLGHVVHKPFGPDERSIGQFRRPIRSVAHPAPREPAVPHPWRGSAGGEVRHDRLTFHGIPRRIDEHGDVRPLRTFLIAPVTDETRTDHGV